MRRLLVCGFIAALWLTAASPVADITSEEPFLLSGTRVPVAGVPNWPLVDGDVVVLASSPALVKFRDGTQLYVLPESRFKITVAAKQVGARLEEGGLSYKYAKDSAVELAALSNKAIPRKSGQGLLISYKGEAWWNPADPKFMQLPGVVRQANGDTNFGGYRITPFNLNFVDKWTNYNPGWGNKPGFQPPGPPGPIPPGPVLRPPGVPPVSPTVPPKGKPPGVPPDKPGKP